MSETPAERSQPVEPIRRFSVLVAAQDEIDTRFSYIMDDLGLSRIEREFDPRPSAMERMAKVGNFLLRVMPSYRMRG